MWDRKWIFFVCQQAALLTVGWAFLHLVRWYSGRTIHAAKNPLGAINTLFVFVLWIAVSAGTYVFYRLTEGTNAPPFGVPLSLHKTVDFLAGLVTGLIVVGSPKLLGILVGTISITETIRAHYSPAAIVGYVLLGFLLLLGNSLSEEITSRAYPMQLFREKALWIRILLPSVFFAIIHLADERFKFSAFYERTIAGVVLSIAYAISGNIWLASGIHTGMNASIVWTNGAWWVGALVKTTGRAIVPDWALDLVWTLVSVIGFAYLVRRGKPTSDRVVPQISSRGRQR
jgi:membrane protease YdiL (CAAX protease family)